MLMYLFMKSAGVGVGVLLGCLIGLSIRSRKGKTEGLLAESVILTSVAAALVGLCFMMLITYMGMQR
ncbi:hypothetical protein P775_09690 [Puniceibacterium antarcticum]|uniref:Uncharacterized protein n=1 Tax=Puniceibacterium antarcticum TaxID=1206336 RepID=A0A2G8RFV0_9RHOB|nr:hypothetical protein [Puniceibacterium antarcticum]PIL20402.1 hypothetical protein P775_09690 [Puniceibacterium antarcticum]